MLQEANDEPNDNEIERSFVSIFTAPPNLLDPACASPFIGMWYTALPPVPGTLFKQQRLHHIDRMGSPQTKKLSSHGLPVSVYEHEGRNGVDVDAATGRLRRY